MDMIHGVCVSEKRSLTWLKWEKGIGDVANIKDWIELFSV
jgi:hypothetical protein